MDIFEDSILDSKRLHGGGKEEGTYRTASNTNNMQLFFNSFINYPIRLQFTQSNGTSLVPKWLTLMVNMKFGAVDIETSQDESIAFGELSFAANAFIILIRCSKFGKFEDTSLFIFHFVTWVLIGVALTDFAAFIKDAWMHKIPKFSTFINFVEDLSSEHAAMVSKCISKLPG